MIIVVSRRYEFFNGFVLKMDFVKSFRFWAFRICMIIRRMNVIVVAFRNTGSVPVTDSPGVQP